MGRNLAAVYSCPANEPSKVYSFVTDMLLVATPLTQSPSLPLSFSYSFNFSFSLFLSLFLAYLTKNFAYEADSSTSLFPVILK